MRGLLSCLLVGCAADHDGYEPVDCNLVTTDDTFVVGLEKPGKSGLLTFKLMSVAPAPPARGNNTWIVDITRTVDTTPFDGAAIRVTPYMVSHPHGTAIVAHSTPISAAQYELSPVNFSMEGVWETTIRATIGDETDSAAYTFCIP